MTQATADTGFRYEHLGRLLSLMTGAEKHGPAATSTLDVLWVLYDRVLRVGPESAEDDGRDRFLLSKGHGPMAYYAVLAAKGFFPVDWLSGLGPTTRPSDTTRTTAGPSTCPGTRTRPRHCCATPTPPGTTRRTSGSPSSRTTRRAPSATCAPRRYERDARAW